MRLSMSSIIALDLVARDRVLRLDDRRADVLVEREVVVAPVVGELADDRDLGRLELAVGRHDEREQFERGGVLLVGGGVDRDPSVQLGETIFHRFTR